MRYLILTLMLCSCAPLTPDANGRCDITFAMLMGFQPCGDAWHGDKFGNPGPWTDRPTVKEPGK